MSSIPASSTLSSSERLSTSLSSQTQASSFLKTRVRSVDPNNGRCLIEDVTEHNAVDFVHCFPKRKAGRQSLIASLEWHWNMDRGTLNLDTRYNVFPVRPHLHRLYGIPDDVGSWMLMPEEHIVKRYFDYLIHKPLSTRADRTSFPLIENTRFFYRFTPLTSNDAIQNLIVTRREVKHSKNPCQGQGNNTLHVYPFDTLPLVESHLHPKFAIMEIGRKLNEMPNQILAVAIVEEQPILKQICAIYSAWTRPCPKEFILGTGSYGNSLIASETMLVDSSNSTPPPAWRSYLKRRFYKCVSGQRYSSTLAGSWKKNRKRCLNHLSQKTLLQHTKVLGKRKWDSESVEQWVDSCEPSPGKRVPWGDPSQG